MGYSYIDIKFLNRAVKLVLALLFFSMEFLMGQNSFSKMDALQLSPPKVMIDSVLFVNSATVSVAEGEIGSTAFYEIDGAQEEYIAPIVLKDSKAINFWSEHSSYKKSDTHSIEVVKINKALVNAQLVVKPQPNEAYMGEGTKSLNNLIKGTTSFRNENEWLGFQDNSVTIEINFENPTQISLMQLGILVDHGSWIFCPRQITISSQDHIVGEKLVEVPEGPKNSTSTFLSIAVEPNKYKNLKVVIQALEGIPEWHPGKGTMPWTFIDELLIEN